MSDRHGWSPASPISWLDDIKQVTLLPELVYMHKMGYKTELSLDSGERPRFHIHAIQLDLIKKHN